MPQAPVPDEPVLPRWLLVVGSAVILVHLTAIIVPILDVPSGPWIGPQPQAAPPKFVESVRDCSTFHSEFLRVANGFQFASDRPALTPSVEFEVLLKDEQGNLIETLHIPDPKANPWVRHRQGVLAMALGLDHQLPPPGAEAIPSPGAPIPMTTLWVDSQDRREGDAPVTESVNGHRVQFLLKEKENHLLPHNQALTAPSDWSQVLVRSYARYLCRAHGAARVEVVRLKRENIPPFVLFGEELPPDFYREQVATFGEKASKDLNAPLGKKSR